MLGRVSVHSLNNDMNHVTTLKQGSAKLISKGPNYILGFAISTQPFNFITITQLCCCSRKATINDTF